MIRHREAGLGHPYRLEPDQRIPANPEAGQPIELRATTPRSVGRLEVEVEIGGRRQRTRATRASRDQDGSAGRPGSRGRLPWSVCLPPLAEGTRVRYAFFADTGERTRWFAFTVAGWQPDGGRLIVETRGAVGPGPESDRLVAGSVSCLRDGARTLRIRFALRLEPGAHVVGFGERFDALDQRGRRIDTTVFEQYKNQGNRTYLPVPFAIVMPTDGRPTWGFHVRTSRRAWFDVGASEPERLWVEVAIGIHDRDPSVAVSIYGGTPADVLAAFLLETGEPVQPPEWIFRPWMSSNEWNTEARVRAEVERTLSEGIPVGVLVVEAWSDETTFAAFRDAQYPVHSDGSPHRLVDFAFPADGAWPDPKGLVDWLHDHDIRLLLWQVPLLKARPAPSGQARADLDVMVARGYGVREADGRPYRNRGWWFPGALLPDWTSPEASAWWIEKRRYLVEDLGIDGFKTDGGEHAWGDDLRYADGTRGGDTNNRYPGLYSAAYHELLRSAGRQPLTFSRAGFTGAATVPAHWAGDENSTWGAFRGSITAGLSAAASGVFFWGWDLGGFSGEIPSAELYLRAAAMACFCPIMQYHSEFNRHRRPSRDRTPWNISERTGAGWVIPIYRRFARLRELLLPYLGEQAKRSVERRVPLMRALLFDWPSDPEIWRHPYEYLLGDDLLVAPVVEPDVDTWEVYLPLGEWVDVWSGERIDGARIVKRRAPLEIIPVYRRAGAVGVPDLHGEAPGFR